MTTETNDDMTDTQWPDVIDDMADADVAVDDDGDGSGDDEDSSDDLGDVFPTGPSLALWEGDRGFLTLQQRRTFVALLKNRYITPATPGGVWATLVEDQEPFHSRLNELFLELEIDRHHQVAYKVQAKPETTSKSFPTVLHDQQWSREETILLVYLRMRFRSGYGGTEKVFIDVEEIVEHVQSFRPPTDQAISRGKSTTRSAVETVRKAGILIGKEGAERYEISPIIEVLLTEARVEQLLAWLIEQTGDLDIEHPASTRSAPGSGDRTGNNAEPAEDGLFAAGGDDA